MFSYFFSSNKDSKLQDTLEILTNSENDKQDLSLEQKEKSKLNNLHNPFELVYDSKPEKQENESTFPIFTLQGISDSACPEYSPVANQDFSNIIEKNKYEYLTNVENSTRELFPHIHLSCKRKPVGKETFSIEDFDNQLKRNKRVKVNDTAESYNLEKPFFSEPEYSKDSKEKNIVDKKLSLFEILKEKVFTIDNLQIASIGLYLSGVAFQLYHWYK